MISSDSSFGTWLKQRRKGLDLTQEALAELAGCSTDMVRKIEGGAARPSRQMTELLLASLDVPPHEQTALIIWARTGQLSAQNGHSTASVEIATKGSRAEREPEGAEAENPYKGLRAFQERDVADFFGREALTARLFSRMSGTEELSRFLAVVGPSGSGKSSVVRAGLLPALRQDRLPGGITPVVVEMVPGSRPLEELEAALLRVAVNPPASLLEQLTFDARGLARAVKRVLPVDERIQMLLFIDQFEELFTLARQEERITFLSSLFEAVTDPLARLWAVVTLRADFYNHPLMYIPSSELVGKRTEVVGPLTQSELYRAIVGPAERAGLELEKDLVSTIIHDVADQPGTLPLLQYTLTELYERRAERLLTLRGYNDSGGVLGSLANRAESLFKDLTNTEQVEARQLFLRLVTLGEGAEDTRRRVRMGEVASASRDESALGRVLDVYGRFRMLTFDRDPVTGVPTVEVAHEALLGSWPRLREWLDNGRDALRVQRRLMSTSTDWQASGREVSFLASGARLAQFEALAAGDDLALTAEEQAFLSTSVEHERERAATEGERQARELTLQKRAASRLRSLVAALVVFLFIAGALSLWALNRSQAAEENAASARVQSKLAQVRAVESQQSAATAEASFARSEDQRFITEANLLVEAGGDHQLAALLAIRSMKDHYSSQGSAALLKVSTLNYPRQVFSGRFAVFSPDGRYVLSADLNQTSRLWDTQTGKQVRQFVDREDYGFDVNSIAFSPDGQHILTSTAVNSHLWATGTGTEEHMLQGHVSAIETSAFSHDGKYVVTGGDDRTARIWDVHSGKLVQQFSGHSDVVYSVAFSPDDKLIVTGSSDKTARIWDAATGRDMLHLTGHAGTVRSVIFSPDVKYILTGSEDGTARIWSSSAGLELNILSGHAGSVNSAAYSPDGKFVLTGGADKTVRTWDSKSGQELQRFTAHKNSVRSVAFSPDGGSLLTGSADNTVRVWDARAHLGVAQFRGHTGEIYTMQLSPDDKSLLTSSLDKTARLWDTGSGQMVQQFTGQEGWVTSAALSPDGKLVVTGSTDKTARVWDASTGSALLSFVDFLGGTLPGDPTGSSLDSTDPVGSIVSVIFSPDGHDVLSGYARGGVLLWEAKSGKVLQRLHPGTTAPAAGFSHDGKFLVTSLSVQLSSTYGAETWSAATGQPIRFFKGHTGQVTAVTFSADDKYILTGSADKTVRMWDAETGTEVHRFVGHTDAVTNIDFSRDGKQIITASLDNTVRVWDAQTAQELHRFDGEAIGARRVTFSSDDRYVLASHADNTVSMWPMDYHDTVKSLCKRLLRDLTDEERTEYGITDKAPTCPKY